MPSRKKTNKPKFLKNCDENGRLFYNYFFDKVEEKGYKPEWGYQGVRYKAKVNGDARAKVAFFIGYPDKDIKGQYVCVDFSLLSRKIGDAELIAKQFRPMFVIRDFIREGSYVKWYIKKRPSSEKMEKITNLFLDLAKAIERSHIL